MDALPPSLAGRLQELEQRIAILERSNKMVASTITGGTLRVLTSSGTPIVELGEIDSGVNGLRVYRSDGTTAMLQVDQLNGFARPWPESYWRPYQDTDVTHSTEGYGEVTGSTFRRLWRITNELLYGPDMLYRVIVTCPAGSTGEIRLWNNSGSAVLGGTLSVPAATTTTTYEYRLTHGLTLGTGPHNIYMEARVDTGAGALRIYWPGGVHWGDVGGTVAGGWV